jgi:cation diffusion facilitator family transporter
MTPQSDSERSASEQRTALASIAAAAVLVALKLGVGLVSGSLALISAGIESSGDVIAAVLTFFAVRLGGRPADRGHPYGHRRAENLGALGEAAILLGGGVFVSIEAIKALIEGGRAPAIHWYMFAVILVAILVDISRTSISFRAARRLESPALHSNAMHFAGDMAGSLAVLAGLLAVDAGVAEGDAVAALVVALIIFIAAANLIRENANVLMDRSPASARTAAEEAITGLGEDIEVSRLRVRESAGRYFADVVVSVPPGQAVVEGHRAADLVEGAIERVLPGSDVVVHVEPRRLGLDLRDRVLAIALSEPLVKEAHDIIIFEQQGAASVSLHLKFPADLELGVAHEISERVEQSIRARPQVNDVQTHLEPLELPLEARDVEEQAVQPVAREVEDLVRELTGAAPQRLKLLATDGGSVLFLTLEVGEGESLTRAHELAGELEDQLRRRIPGIAEVIVHTEP